MIETEFLFVSLMEGFEWFDESLQRSLKAAGIPQLSRTESMIMIHVQMNIVRPAEIARNLRLTRQAVHLTIGSLVKRGVFELRPDPGDKRVKIVALTEKGRWMRKNANRIVREVTDVLAYRIGQQQIDALRSAFRQPWGDPVTLDSKPDPEAPRDQG
ncbi:MULTISPECIES: MarR family winged helix-turn-helix transcriptional regulator [Sphingopyxis]|uniref:MarR family transcriptional regulator n=1 Tax=Sphingopyxis granuli TaxID=267128 RepID=A0AA86GGG9_9SPHN|nr:MULTISPECIES: MarR family winged helix-turn-helix transcriptional regulator [Sphingopyxis]AMG72627.1 MarR family transcriptional regulator [Sphingopyxis granuli]AVA15429.1 MarR family transcriptional regulator [Sphingopyxis sp. MG]QUM72753.1 winged helix-turn-helix transcriptional regulator [Sphingopyxis granuli]UNK80033.1 MarR family winged helix-turn-helix transcriptional regulator [Sphingopyxis granuli]